MWPGIADGHGVRVGEAGSLAALPSVTFGAVSFWNHTTGSTQIATTAIIAPGAGAQPVESMSFCPTSGANPPKMAVAVVNPALHER
ncbi:hypothetical protein, partial [Dermacoccus sp. Ellin185]|uniref:hypothetical protein n=1 Tax=Dermacoccus sp. Ellin185 TaxID=188626 RepID=UPI001C30F3DE